MRNFSYIILRLIQISLVFLTYFSFTSILDFGEKFKETGGLELKPQNIQGWEYEIINGTSITSGFNGAALGLGIITAACISLITFIEIKLFTSKN